MRAGQVYTNKTTGNCEYCGNCCSLFELTEGCDFNSANVVLSKLCLLQSEFNTFAAKSMNTAYTAMCMCVCT